MWHFTFDAPVNTRILNSRFFGITHFSDSQIWWSEKKRKWMSYEECIKYYNKNHTFFSNHEVLLMIKLVFYVLKKKMMAKFVGKAKKTWIAEPVF
jgi:hypothetical protein